MAEETIELAERPWETLRAALNAGDAKTAHEIIDSLSATDNARALLQLEESERTRLFKLIDIETAAWLVEQLPDETAASMIEELDAADAADILEELDSDDRADVLGEMDEADAAAILDEMEKDESDAARQLMSYDYDTAGGLMMTEMFKFHRNETVAAVLKKLSDPADDFERYRGGHPYIVDDEGKLQGVVSLRQLLTTARSTELGSIMSPAISVKPEAPISEIRDLFDEHPFLSLPVTDAGERLIGAVSRDALAEAELERAESEVQKLQGL